MCCLPELGRVLVPKPHTSSGMLGKDEVVGSLFHHTPFHNPVRFLGTLAKAEHWHSTSRVKVCSPVTVRVVEGVLAVDQNLFITVAVEKEQRTVAYNKKFQGFHRDFLLLLSVPFTYKTGLFYTWFLWSFWSSVSCLKSSKQFYSFSNCLKAVPFLPGRKE